ncbi:MAG: UMP kinase [FCB group bacterium]|nr:UMP kinase [FCB group bacterium]
MTDPRYRRILLKLSGEILAGDVGFGYDPPTIKSLAKQIKAVYDLGVQIGLVVGAGNIFRGSAGIDNGIERVTGDYMGMTATVMNAVALQSALEHQGCDTRVMSALEITQLGEPYIRRRALRHLEKNRIAIFAGGTGNPYFTTDTAAALRAIEINAEVIIKGTKVNGVYDKDPEKEASARLYDRLSFKKVIENELRVMDLTAVTLCKENNLPIVVLNIKNDENLQGFIRGKNIGTTIS